MLPISESIFYNKDEFGQPIALPPHKDQRLPGLMPPVLYNKESILQVDSASESQVPQSKLISHDSIPLTDKRIQPILEPFQFNPTDYVGIRRNDLGVHVQHIHIDIHELPKIPRISPVYAGYRALEYGKDPNDALNHLLRILEALGNFWPDGPSTTVFHQRVGNPNNSTLTDYTRFIHRFIREMVGEPANWLEALLDDNHLMYSTLADIREPHAAKRLGALLEIVNARQLSQLEAFLVYVSMPVYPKTKPHVSHYDQVLKKVLKYL
jgi:hypothetical protein